MSTDPAYHMAVEQLNKRYGDVLNISLITSSARGCLDMLTSADEVLARDHYRNEQSVTVFITSADAGCQTTDISVMSWINSWNQLSINTPGAQYYYPDLQTQLNLGFVCSACFPRLAIRLIEYYDWDDIFILTDLNSVPANYGMGSGLVQLIKEQVDVHRTYIMRWINSVGNWSFKGVVSSFHDLSRVMFFYGHAGQLRQLLITAAEMNMTDGQYIYIAADLGPFVKYGLMSWKYNDSQDQVAKEAFNSLLVIRPVQATMRKTDFSDNLSTAFQQHSATHDHIYYDEDYGLSQILFGVYDAVLVIGQVLYEAVLNHEDLSDARKLMHRHFLNQTFTTDLGVVYIDPYGVRREDLAVTHFNTETDRREIFLVQYRTANGTITPFGHGHVDNWPGGQTFPPPSQPKCGFKDDSSKCKYQNKQNTVLQGVLGASVVFSICCCAILLGRIKRMRRRPFWNTWWIIISKELAE